MAEEGLTFRVEALNVSIDATLAAMVGADDLPITADVTAGFDLPVGTARDLFIFQSDAVDITDADADDLKYKVVYVPEDNKDANGDPMPLSEDWLVNTVCSDGDAIYTESTSNSASGSKAVPFEFVRYLAKKLFNTSLGVDLFSNEEALRNDLNVAAREGLDAKLIELEALGFVTKDNVGTGNTAHPSYVILSKIIQNQPSRLAGLGEATNELFISGGSTDNSGTGTAPTFRMPINVGDSIEFKLTINAAEDQELLTGVAAIDPRTYRIVMSIVADP